ncbi:MAG: hypothetical protein ACRDRK_22520 [Pseudonocardia sp.]
MHEKLIVHPVIEPENDMTALETLPGIGSGLAAELRAVGVRDAEMLRAWAR